MCDKILEYMPENSIKPNTSQRSSMESISSKVFEKLLLQILKPILNNIKLTFKHKFRHNLTTKQVYKIVNTIFEDMERKKYCCAVFLDISLIFDKV